jgi:hypothetical protein
MLRMRILKYVPMKGLKCGLGFLYIAGRKYQQNFHPKLSENIVKMILIISISFQNHTKFQEKLQKMCHLEFCEYVPKAKML